MPPPDESETADLDQELLAIEAALDDLTLHLRAKGHDEQDMLQQPEAYSPPAEGIASALQEQMMHVDSIKRQRLQWGGHMLPSEAAAQSMLYGTDRSLGDIDAAMQARGYR